MSRGNYSPYFFLKGNVMTNEELIEDFLVRVSEMYQYNLEQYPEENPTMIGALCEILEEIRKEKL